ncbi:MAG: glycosyltransferase family 2 protein [Saprospiraceae bacterium]|nr:MAG: glycosyltransferase family 2 protein [Saprospiraceae bacterium]
MLKRLTVPDWVQRHTFSYDDYRSVDPVKISSIRLGLGKLNSSTPAVSIIIPAYNEEKCLLNTLSSLSELQPTLPTELIVVNNNSTDGTQEILDKTGVRSIMVQQQGVTYARQAGLEMTKGKYILSGDADSIYPPDWGNEFVAFLAKKTEVACVYGYYSFIPTHRYGRLILSFHELAAEMFFKYRQRQFPFINVVGFNCAFRREQALAAGGYDHAFFHANNNRGEDGYLAMKLAEKFGAIEQVPTTNRVWTSDRRLLEDGSLVRAFLNRVKRHAAV